MITLGPSAGDVDSSDLSLPADADIGAAGLSTADVMSTSVRRASPGG